MYARTAMIAALLSIATVTHAATDRDRWLTRLDNYAVHVGMPRDATVVDAFAHAKAACICTEEGSLFRRPGYIVVGDDADGLSTFCVVPSFDDSGALELAAGCQSFVPLAK